MTVAPEPAEWVTDPVPILAVSIIVPLGIGAVASDGQICVEADALFLVINLA